MRRRSIGVEEILTKLRGIQLDDADVVVAVGRGGIVPAAIVARELELDVVVLWVRCYTDEMPPKKAGPGPEVVRPFVHDVAGKRVLLVDDVARSGETIVVARRVLLEKGAKDVRALVVAGNKSKADVCLFETDDCVRFPWSN